MTSIDTNMSIFDSPLAKRPPPPTTNHSRPAQALENSQATVLDVSYDASNDDENDDSNRTERYEDLMKQAAKWKAGFHGVLDTVYKLQVEAAIILDTYSMMYPAQDLDDFPADNTAAEGSIDEESDKSSEGDLESSRFCG